MWAEEAFLISPKMFQFFFTIFQFTILLLRCSACNTYVLLEFPQVCSSSSWMCIPWGWVFRIQLAWHTAVYSELPSDESFGELKLRCQYYRTLCPWRSCPLGDPPLGIRRALVGVVRSPRRHAQKPTKTMIIWDNHLKIHSSEKLILNLSIWINFNFIIQSNQIHSYSIRSYHNRIL